MASTWTLWRLPAKKVLCCLFLFLGTQAAAQDSYPLGPGDVLGVDIASEPRIKHDLTIEIDGNVVFPLIGQVSVAGRTIAELQAEIPVLYSGTVYRERIQGEDILVSLRADDTFLEVVRYRPVYLDGLVREPGAMPFEVGLTARQAIAYAQGIGLPQTSSSRNRRETKPVGALSNELVSVLAEVARLRAILVDAEEIDASEVRAVSADQGIKDRAIELANDQLATSLRLFKDEVSFIEESIKSTEEQIVSSLRQKEAMTDITASEESEVDRISALVARRAASTERLAEAKRVYLQAVGRLRDISSETLRLQPERRELMRTREEAIQERRLRALEGLRQLTPRVTELQEELAPLTGALAESDPASGFPSQTSVSIVIYRLDGKDVIR